MDKAAEHGIPTIIHLEAIPGPSTEGVPKSHISSNIFLPDKRAINENNKTENMNMQKVKIKNTQLGDISLSHKRTTSTIPFTTQRASEMVMNSIAKVGKSDGASFEDISKYMEVNYHLNMELFDPCVKMLLKKNKDKGLLDRMEGRAGEERFKIKKSESVKKATENLLLKERMDTQVKKLPAQTANVVSMKRTMNTGGNIENKKLKIVNTKVLPERKNLMGKAPRSKTGQMVLDAITSLKKRNGATFEDIRKHIEENQHVKVNRFITQIHRFLTKSVENGTLEKLSGTNAVGKYKIKKS